MKLIDCLNAKNAITALLDQNLSFSTSYNIMLVTEKIEKDEKFYHDQLKPLIDEYSEKDEEGKVINEEDNIKIKKSCVQEFNNKIINLQQTEIPESEVKLSREDLKEVKLTPRQIFLLKPFME